MTSSWCFRLVPFSMLLFFTMFLSGCVEEMERTFTINPDGSGKVNMQLVLSPSLISQDRSAIPQDLQKRKKHIARTVIENVHGVDAWRNISYRWRDDGSLYFSGVAYFSDFNKFAGKGMNMQQTSILNFNFYSFSTGKKTYQLTTDEEDRNSEEKEEPDDSSADSEDEKQLSERKQKLLKRIKQRRFDLLTPMYEMMFHIKISDTFHLPGPVTSSTGMEKENDTTVRFQFDGKQQVKKLKRPNSDAGESSSDILRRIKKIGEQMLASKTVKGRSDDPLFNYQEEVREARKDSVKTLYKLRINRNELYPPTFHHKGSFTVEQDKPEFSGVQVDNVRMQLQKQKNKSKELHLELSGRFSSPVTDVQEGRVDQLVLNSGETLKNEKERILFPDLNDLGDRISFDVWVPLPKKPFSSIRRVTGSFKILRATELKTVDLGFDRIEESASGDRLDADILNLKPHDEKSQFTIYINLSISKRQLQDITFYDADGEKLDHKRKSTFRYTVQEPVPEKGSIRVTYHHAEKSETVPFTVKNIPLFNEKK